MLAHPTNPQLASTQSDRCYDSKNADTATEPSQSSDDESSVSCEGEEQEARPWPSSRWMHDIHFQLGKSAAVELTDDVAVFVTSPASMRRSRRGVAVEKARTHGGARRLRRFGLLRSRSVPARLVSVPDPKGEKSDAHIADEEEEEVRDEGVKRRASELALVANLKLQAQKQRLTFASSVPEDGELSEADYSLLRTRRRQMTCEAGRSFTEFYGRTLGLLEHTMTLEPPKGRRHSISIQELHAYSPVSSASASPSKPRSDRRLSFSLGAPTSSATLGSPTSSRNSCSLGAPTSSAKLSTPTANGKAAEVA